MEATVEMYDKSLFAAPQVFPTQEKAAGFVTAQAATPQVLTAAPDHSFMLVLALLGVIAALIFLAFIFVLSRRGA